jgi:transposase InsO family protein
MSLLGVYTVTFDTAELGPIDWPFIIAESMASEAILGVDFLSHFKAVINVEQKSVQFEKQPRWGTVTAAHEGRIPPFSRRVIRARPSTKSRGAFAVTLPRKQGVMAGIQEWRSPEKGYQVLVVNGGPEWMEIRRGEELAEYWQVEEEEICTVEQFAKCRPKGKESDKLSAEKQRMISEEVRTHLGPEFKRKLTAILQNHHQAISQDSADLGRTAAVPHKLVTKSDKQIYRKQFPLPAGHQEFIYKTVDDLMKIGAIKEDLASPHNTPIFAVKKPHSNDLRLVQDLRSVNDNIENFQHPILDIPGCIAKLGGMEAKYFAALDLTSGFYQLELDKESQPLTAFTVPGRGRFSWTVSTMGLKTSPGAFSRLMEHVMKDVPRAVTYMDDVILAGKTPDQLLETIEKALRQLIAFNLKLNLKKCVFGAEEVDYLGYRITAQGARPGKEKTDAVISFPTPRTQQEVKRFLGMANYFRTHIKHFAQRSRPLTQLTRKDTDWTEGQPLPRDAEAAFTDLKKALASEPVTALPLPNEHFVLETDGSGEGLGACLTQQQNGKMRVIGYASRALQEHERNYPAFLLEQAAAVFGIDSFSAYLTGAHFDLVIDHKPLLALSTVHKKTLARLQQLMSEFSFQLRYRTGEENAVADALSRAPVAALAQSYEELRRLQEEDDFCKAAIRLCREGACDEDIDKAAARFLKKIISACFMRDGCVFLRSDQGANGEKELLLTPRKCRYELIRAAHAGRFSGHGGEAKTMKRLQHSYFWPGMAGDVAEFIKSCDVCQRAKDPPSFQRTRAPLQPLPVPDAPNERIHLDLFSVPRTSAAGNHYILVITDAFSKWVELVAIPDKGAETVAAATFNRWICRFACPKQVVTDRGKEFCNQLAEELWRLLEVDHRKTAAYHPQTNTSAESFNRSLIKILRALMEEPDGDWESLLPVVMLTYNTRVHSAVRASPFFLTYLRDPNLPYFDLDADRPLYGESWAQTALDRLTAVQRMAKENMLAAQAAGKEFYDGKTGGKLRSFAVGDQVMVRFDPMSFARVRNKKFFRPWIPHKIKRVITPTTYSVEATEPGRGFKKTSTVHVNRIKRRYERGEEEAEAASDDEREEEEQEQEQEEEEDEPAGIFPEDAGPTDLADEEAEDGEEAPPVERRARRLTRAQAAAQGVRVDPILPPPSHPPEYRRRR